MTAGGPWNESGLGPELRDAAREAARRSGVSVEEWLKSAIIGTAAEAGVQPPRRTAEPLQSSTSSSTISSRLDELSARLERLTRGAPPVSAPPVPQARASAPAAPANATSLQLADAVARMNERLDHLIAARSGTDFAPRAPVADRPAPQQMKAPSVVPDTSPLGIERAIAEIAERQRMLEEGPPMAAAAPEPQPVTAPAPGPDLSGLEAQLRHITAQLETLRRPCGVEDAVAELRRDLNEITRTLQEAMPRRALEALQAEVRALGERIDRGRDRAFDQTALTGIEQGLSEVRNALTALRPAESFSGVDADLKELSRKIDLLAETGPDPELLRYLETAIGELRALAARVASADTVSSLVDDVRSLAASVDRVAASERGGGLDALATRIEALAQSLDTRGAERPAMPSNIEQLLGSLADKFERMQVTHNDQPALDHIEEQIVRLATRIEDSNQRLGNLGTIEHAIGELMYQVKEARAEAVAAAERVARAVVAEVGSAPAGHGEVETLKRDLTELKLDRSASDRRTHDTLEAVHDTLERVVDRLAMIESDVRASSRSRPEYLPHEPAPPIAAAMPQPGPTAPSQTAQASQAVMRAQAAKLPQAATVAPRRPINPDLPADTPLEPGSRERSAASPAERIAASEAALSAVKPQGAEPTGKANFIAAARRAAQAAASETGPGAGAAEGQSDEKASGGLMGRLLGNRRRTLMIGIAAFVLVVGSWQIANLFSPAPRTEVPGARSEARPSMPERPSSAMQLNSGAVEPAAPVIVPPATNRQSGLLPAGEMTPPPAGVMAPAMSETLNPSPMVAPPAAEVTGSVARPQSTAALTPQPPAPATPANGLPAGIGGPALRNAALAGDPAAEYEIGLRYTDGRGVPVNLEEAARWFERAANQGLTPAIYRLGSMYEKGQGVKKNLDTARRLYLAAAEKGNAKAMHNIAVLHAEGVEGKPDYRAAAQWFRKAAAHGIADSQYNLGILFARGIGVEQNLAESYKWFALAADQGDQDAGKKREDVAARLDKQALVAAKLAAQTFTADAPPAEAMTVAAPAGGWDKADAQSAKPKPAATARPKAKAS